MFSNNPNIIKIHLSERTVDFYLGLVAQLGRANFFLADGINGNADPSQI